MDKIRFESERIVSSAGPSITEKEIEMVTEAIRDGWYEKRNMHIEQFIKEFKKYTGLKYVLPVCNCTSAIHLALLALGIKEGDEVIVPDITWVASAAPITYCGAKPVFVDIDKDSWCIDPKSFEKAITSKTKVVIVVNLYGNMPDMDKIIKIARKNNISVIEDAAEAMGSEYNGKKAGTFGDINVFSFNATKIIMAGQGGVVGTNDIIIYNKCKKLSHHGMSDYSDKTFWSEEIGYNYQWTNIQAALALAQLRRLDELVEFKRGVFNRYRYNLSGVPGIQFGSEVAGVKNTYWIVSVILNGLHKMKKEDVMAQFKEHNIDSRPFFYPISSMPAYAKYVAGRDMKKVNPISYGISSYGISFPSSFALREEEIDYVCDVFLKMYSRR